MSRENADSTGKYHQLILEARWQMQQARNQAWDELASHGSVSQGTKKQVATRALQYYDVLWEFKETTQTVAEGWKKSDVDKIKQWGTEKTTIQQPAAGDTAATNSRTVPKLMTVDAETIIAISKQLDDIALNLGFSAGVDEGRDLGHIGPKQEGNQ